MGHFLNSFVQIQYLGFTWAIETRLLNPYQVFIYKYALDLTHRHDFVFWYGSVLIVKQPILVSHVYLQKIKCLIW